MSEKEYIALLIEVLSSLRGMAEIEVKGGSKAWAAALEQIDIALACQPK